MFSVSDVVVNLSTLQVVIGLVIGLLGLAVTCFGVYIAFRTLVNNGLSSFAQVLASDNYSLRQLVQKLEEQLAQANENLVAASEQLEAAAALREALEKQVAELKQQIETYMESNRQIQIQLDQVQADLENCVKHRQLHIKPHSPRKVEVSAHESNPSSPE